jgi:6-phosphogluconolactonase
MNLAAKLEVLEDAPAVARRAASLIEERLRNAVIERGTATFAVSGGRTPARMLRALAREDLAWEHLDLFQVDERAAPEGHPERNATAIRSAFATRLELHPERFHWMLIEQPDLAAGARAYEDTLRSIAGRPAVLDLVQLGIGEDGHTASIFPGAPAQDAATDVTPAAAHGGWRRMTLTMPAINRARFIVWVVTGSAKRQVLSGLLAGDPSLVASRVRRTDVAIIADADAAPSSVRRLRSSYGGPT